MNVALILRATGLNCQNFIELRFVHPILCMVKVVFLILNLPALRLQKLLSFLW